MKISELAAMLSKVQQLAGDVEVVLKGAESEVETVIQDFAVHLSPSTEAAGDSLTVTHGTAAASPPPAEPVDGSVSA